MMHLRFPVTMKKLRILIYARYSTEEQHPTSIDDQYSFCEEFLKANGITDAVIERICDKEMSGELVSRPGIDRVRAGIADRRWDWIVSEDSSRLYRNETACGDLIETAVDKGLRVLCPNDDVDTSEEDWEDALHEAQHHHARSNRYTAKRIKRKLLGLWRMGAAIGLLRPGYRRHPTTRATASDREEGPFFDEVDPKWAPLIAEAYSRSARNDPAWSVAQWLTQQGVPKTANSSVEEWTEKNVIALLRRTIYRGVEEYQKSIIKKEYRSGRHKQVRNEENLVLRRDMPHLRIVPDDLWYAANEAIDSRTLRKYGPTGADHPLAGIPRDSRNPLSTLFVCGICGGKMYMEGRAEGGYRCGNAHKGLCWNKATVKRSLAHERISNAVVSQLVQLRGALDDTVNQVRQVFADDLPVHGLLAEARSQEAELVRACRRLTVAIESSDEPPESLVPRLSEQEKKLAKVRAEVKRLEGRLAAPKSLPDRGQIEAKIAQVSGRLLDMDSESCVLLRRLVTPIRAIPHQQFGSNLVVLRARFELQLVELVAENTSGLSASMLDRELASRLRSIPVAVNLFEPSAGPRLFAKALQLSEAGLTLEAIGRELGVAKRQAHIAVSYGRDMRAAGLTDPYLELKDPPTAASRWREHPRLRKSG